MRDFLEKTYVSILKLPYKIFYVWPLAIYKIIRNLLSIINFSYLSEQNTIYPSEKRIGRVRIFYLLIKWYIKYHEVNYSFYLYGMDRKVGKDREQLMGHREFREYRDNLNMFPQMQSEDEYNYLCLARDKFIFSRYLSSVNIPVVKDWAIFNKTALRWLNTGEEIATESFFKKPDRKLDGFCKPIGGIKGKGLFTLKLDNGNLWVNDNEATFDQFIEKVNCDYLFQEKINQHTSLNEIYPKSVNTVRLVTFYNNGDPELVFGVFRIGSDGRQVDNFSVGGVVVGIDVHNGKLLNQGIYNGNDKPEIVYKHPDTGFTFKGFEIPWFHEAVEVVTSAHKWMYGFHSLGWDIAITSQGPVLIEANDNWGGKLIMMTNNGFKDKFMKYNTHLSRKKTG